MNLANLVHHHRHSTEKPAYSQRHQHIVACRTRTAQLYDREMASALTASPYTSQPSVYAQLPHHPPSPPVEDITSKCTLPSIQSLIGMAETSAPKHEQRRKLIRHFEGLPDLTVSIAEMEKQQQQRRQPERKVSIATSQSSDYASPNVSDSKAAPPSPPQRPDFASSGLNGSPSASSSHSSVSVPQYFGGAINNIEPHQQRQPPPPSSHPQQSRPPSASGSPYQISPYPQSPGTISTYSYPSPAQQSIGPPSVYYQQRPLPSTFPPPIMPATVAPPMSHSHEASPVDQSNPWQHHHYISPSSSAAFAGQSQDRYVCQTCSKAFSRPSSLRIHSHSHTGEKPFKCPHTGCSKAFSVRSNMKRHERGCHGGGSPGST